MTIYCPRCERRHDLSDAEVAEGSGAAAAALAQVRCACGASLQIGPRARMRLIGRRADRVCRMILTSGTPAVEIAIERGRLREMAHSFFPDRMDLYEMIYESRFDRLWEQFRSCEEESEAA